MLFIQKPKNVFVTRWETLIERKAVFAALCSFRVSHRMINMFFGFWINNKWLPPWSSRLDGWLGYPKTHSIWVRKFENTVKVRTEIGIISASSKTPIWNSDPSRRQKGKPLEYYPQEAHILLRNVSRLRSMSSMLH